MSSILRRLLCALPFMFMLPATAAEMTVAPIATTSAPQPYMLIRGDIEAGDLSRFLRAIRDNPGVVGVALASQGGSLDDGLAIAKQIYERRLDTALVASCHSVCAVMFLAGNEKYVPAEFTLSVHSAYKALGDYVIRDPDGNGTVTWFLGYMGYPIDLARLWLGTEPEDAARITWAMNDRWGLGLRTMKAAN